MTPDHEQAFRAEAERLASLPVKEQRAFIAMLRADSRNRKVPKPDRDFASARADALEHLLKVRKRKRQ